MKKNWLIRTKNNHILGPVSKDKIKDLIANGSIKGDDEICSGNGYWFYIREEDLVTKYVLGDEPQGFNPVQEACVAEIISLSPIESTEEENKLPSQEDLEYPDGEEQKIQLNSSDIDDDIENDIENYIDDITKFDLQLSELQSEADASYDIDEERREASEDETDEIEIMEELSLESEQEAGAKKKTLISNLFHLKKTK